MKLSLGGRCRLRHKINEEGHGDKAELLLTLTETLVLVSFSSTVRSLPGCRPGQHALCGKSHGLQTSHHLCFPNAALSPRFFGSHAATHLNTAKKKLGLNNLCVIFS